MAASGMRSLHRFAVERVIRIKRFHISLTLLILFGFFLFGIPSASADLWKVYAQRTDKAGAEDFWFTIEAELNPDDGISYASIGDVKSFSGVHLTEASAHVTYPIISGLPNLTIGGLTLIGEAKSDTHWNFLTQIGGVAAKRPIPFWEYYTANLVPIPIPSTVLLLGSGLICFIGLRRRFARR